MARMQVTFTVDNESAAETMKIIADACRELADSDERITKVDPREIVPQRTKSL